MTRAAFIHCKELEQYHYPPECPFKTERAGKLLKTLNSMALLSGSDRKVIAPAPAGREVLERFHSPKYLDILQQASRGHCDVEGLYAGLGTPETPVFLGLYEYAALAAGATQRAAELILAGEADIAFNPSGGYHHAHPSQAAGFCYINDVVLAAMTLADAGKRVLILDIDAHHCDGVQDAFYDRNDIMTLSFHEWGEGFFPGTGAVEEMGVGMGMGYSINLPLPEGTDDETFCNAFRDIALEAIRRFSPDVILLELGMDCLAGDPLTHLQLTNNAYADAIGWLAEFNLPILAVGGGGYNVENSVRGWALAWSIMTGEAAATDEMHLGMGGVMLESTDWMGGLRDRILPVNAAVRSVVTPAVEAAVSNIQTNIFPLIGSTS